MVELSVVIPTIIENEEDIEAVQYLCRGSYDDYEVIVRRDTGASKARNEGIKRANADKIVFLDDDSMPREGYLEAASKALDEHDAVAGRVFQPDDSPFKYKDLPWPDEFPFKYKDMPWYDQGDEPKETEWLPGCNMAMTKELLEDVGGFDERIHHGHEETELAERICRDHSIHYHPEMVVDHSFADSVFEYWKKSHRHGKADVRRWEIKDTPRSKRVVQALLLDTVNRSVPKLAFWIAVEAIHHVVRFIGQIDGLLDNRSDS
ncbi:glycosyltransferase [Halogeometricum sp. S1BR25-6]|uniref:Glycosyltransferase n=1 Tax=Halogeometricum salsisoli TaxID=2950536 RepID=A0ABU2GJ45_9EURY|nr:glycosyltransferase [Halogeometricum sp. S1BR25-6]MDS0300289.1 glycosyltransferase [Halogeometricum sp. S1BR25-6]